MAFFSLPWEYLGSITPFSNTFFEPPLARGAEIISPNYRQLGTAVKSHLISATKASLFPVRCQAIEMLLPYLSDDELFSLEHIWQDRSKKTIKAYLVALIDRDGKRLNRYLLQTNNISFKAAEAASELNRTECGDACKDLPRQLYEQCISKNNRYYWDRGDAMWNLTKNFINEETRQLIQNCALDDEYTYTRSSAFKVLAELWPDENTQQLFHKHIAIDGVAASVFAGGYSFFGFIVFRRIPRSYCAHWEGTLDPRKPIPHRHILKAAAEASIPNEKIEEVVKSLSAYMGWDITKGSEI